MSAGFFRLAAFIVCVLSLTPFDAFGQNRLQLFVSCSQGSTTESCQDTNSACTLDRALSLVSMYNIPTTVIIGAGVCTLNSTYSMNNSEQDIEIQGQGAATTIVYLANVPAAQISSNTKSVILMYGGHLQLSDITFRNAPGIVFGMLDGSSGPGTVIAQRVQFVGNSGYYGSAFYGQDTAISVSQSTFSGNSGDVVGGAIGMEGGSLIVDESTFSGNSTGGQGGAIFGNSESVVSISRSTFVGNLSARDGGALAVSPPSNIVNSTFTQNSASAGGAIQAEPGNNGGSVVLSGVTIDSNSAGAGSAIEGGATLEIYDTLVSGSCSNIAQATTSKGSIESPYNTCALNPAQNEVLVASSSLKLGLVANTGGLTQTLTPGAGSALLGAGANCEPIDQRGYVRKASGCDVGAVEASSTTLDEVFADDFDGDGL